MSRVRCGPVPIHAPRPFGRVIGGECWRFSGEGPKSVEQQFNLIVPASELQNLRDYKAYLRTLLAGQPAEPSLISTFPPFGRTGNENRRDRIINTSHQRFSRNRSDVEAKLEKFLTA